MRADQVENDEIGPLAAGCRQRFGAVFRRRDTVALAAEGHHHHCKSLWIVLDQEEEGRHLPSAYPLQRSKRYRLNVVRSASCTDRGAPGEMLLSPLAVA